LNFTAFKKFREHNKKWNSKKPFAEKDTTDAKNDDCKINMPISKGIALEFVQWSHIAILPRYGGRIFSAPSDNF